ncbi:MAG: PfkB family carbohydrate kinase [bacterium]
MAIRDQTNEKIKELNRLEELLDEHRNGRVVAQCHGVFDLLHVGHIDHLEEASQRSDLLVVTITPDEYVNKGPHRPAFDEQRRAEALAALDCVDYVAVNKWPSAEDTIRKLKPDYYVKGPDYEDPEDDPTGKIEEETSAVEEVGGEILITQDTKHSSSGLINRHLSILPEESKQFLADFRQRYSTDDIIKYLEGCRDLDVLVVGEAIIDEYVYVSSLGQSSKAPMLSVKQGEMEKQTGGILAVANHVSNFAGHVEMVAMVGEHDTQEEFIRKNLSNDVEPTFFYRPDSPTIVKRRYIDEYFFNKLFGVYEINDHQLPDGATDELCELLEDRITEPDMVITVDFGHHMLEKKTRDKLSSDSSYLALNAQTNSGNRGYHTITKYESADFPCLAHSELHMDNRRRHGDNQKLLKKTANELSAQRAVVTEGKDGCLGFEQPNYYEQVPAFAGDVVDRIGAGDAFLSISSMVSYQEAPLDIVGFVGNAVGAQAVSTVGNRDSVEYVPLIKQIEALMK